MLDIIIVILLFELWYSLRCYNTEVIWDEADYICKVLGKEITEWVTEWITLHTTIVTTGWDLEY